jgi:hypothetical protein
MDQGMNNFLHLVHDYETSTSKVTIILHIFYLSPDF